MTLESVLALALGVALGPVEDGFHHWRPQRGHCGVGLLSRTASNRGRGVGLCHSMRTKSPGK